MHSFHITSIKDERVVEARELTSAAGRARLHKMQLESEESIQWALEARLPVEHVFYSANLRHDYPGVTAHCDAYTVTGKSLTSKKEDR
jgi:hypothetical protein